MSDSTTRTSVQFGAAPAGRPPPVAGPAEIPALTLRGDARLLETPLLGIFCSVTIPASIVVRLLDAARVLRDASIGTIGGFHSPLERDCLHFLLGGRAAIVVCPAREIRQMRLPPAWAGAMEQGRLLLASCAPEKTRRPTRRHADRRNHLIANFARAILIAHAHPGGMLFPLAQHALGRGVPVFCLADPANRDLELLGATPIAPEHIGGAARELGFHDP
jgi:hypothetical protein